MNLYKIGENEINLTDLRAVGIFPRKHERTRSKKCLKTKTGPGMMPDKRELGGNTELMLRQITLERTSGRSQPGAGRCHHFLEVLEASNTYKGFVHFLL